MLKEVRLLISKFSMYIPSSYEVCRKVKFSVGPVILPTGGSSSIDYEIRDHKTSFLNPLYHSVWSPPQSGPTVSFRRIPLTPLHYGIAAPPVPLHLQLKGAFPLLGNELFKLHFIYQCRPRNI